MYAKDPTLSELISKAVQGDIHAQGVLLEECKAPIAKAVRWVLGKRRSQDDVDEVVQCSQLALLTALPRFQGNSLLKTYAFRLGFTQAQQFLSREHRLVSVDPMTTKELPDGWQETAPSPEEQVSKAELVQKIWSRLTETLSLTEQLCLQYLFQDQLDAPEVAVLLDTTPAHVHQMAYRIRKLARQVGQELSDEPPKIK